MRQHEKKDQYSDVVHPSNENRDSPTIQHLIEQLDRDLKETQRTASKRNKGASS
jgi:hypothetical protein